MNAEAARHSGGSLFSIAVTKLINESAWVSEKRFESFAFLAKYLYSLFILYFEWRSLFPYTKYISY
jgi:hypothetical protein